MASKQKKEVGRPTKFFPDVYVKAEEYLNSCGKEQMSLPSVEGLAESLDITSETVRQWAKKYPEFSLTIKRLADRQKRRLMDDGMYGGKEVNSTMAIFLLKVNHGLIEKSEFVLQAKPYEELSDSQLDKVIETKYQELKRLEGPEETNE